MARTLTARISCLTRTRSWVLMVLYMGLLWSKFCIYAFKLLFSFSFFSGRRSLKLENENNSTKTLRPQKSRIWNWVPRVRVYIQTYPRRLELPLNGTYFHGPSLFEPLKFYCIYSRLSLSRTYRDPLKHFEISVLRHIRFSELRKIQIAQPNLTNDYVSRLL